MGGRREVLPCRSRNSLKKRRMNACIACRPRRNGNMFVEEGRFSRDPRRPSISATRCLPNKPTLTATPPTAARPRHEPLNRTTKVGSYPPNPLGVYDLHGNVWEWCADRYAAEYSAARQNPQGPDNGERRVLRGGSWIYVGRYCRAAYRFNVAPGVRYGYVGFRVVLVAGARAP